MNVEKLQKMAGAVRTGGKGSVRRKKKAVHKTTSTDDKKLQSTLKRLGVNSIPQIEEVRLFKDDNKVIQFLNPKVQALVPANTWVVSGTTQVKNLEDFASEVNDLLNQLGANNFKKIAEQLQKGQAGAGEGSMATIQEDDDEVPDLVAGETFEAAAEGQKS
ncbi:nascent polypeptide-associated complex subunit beta-like [Bidens hawaiensis]|uniref:nascent polypeptide-associated complex subunit beta-like n=1 Tax=Bidens hawaiensis TaxID=980011 RepID=UPI00404AC49A